MDVAQKVLRKHPINPIIDHLSGWLINPITHMEIGFSCVGLGFSEDEMANPHIIPNLAMPNSIHELLNSFAPKNREISKTGGFF